MGALCVLAGGDGGADWPLSCDNNGTPLYTPNGIPDAAELLLLYAAAATTGLDLSPGGITQTAALEAWTANLAQMHQDLAAYPDADAYAAARCPCSSPWGDMPSFDLALQLANEAADAPLPFSLDMSDYDRTLAAYMTVNNGRGRRRIHQPRGMAFPRLQQRPGDRPLRLHRRRAQPRIRPPSPSICPRTTLELYDAIELPVYDANGGPYTLADANTGELPPGNKIHDPAELYLLETRPRRPLPRPPPPMTVS